MSEFKNRRRWLQALGVAGGYLLSTGLLVAQEPQKELKEPLVRVVNRPDLVGIKDNHPLDPALQIAREGLEFIKKDVLDYECTLIKHVFVVL